jgi:hypothetical protein
MNFRTKMSEATGDFPRLLLLIISCFFCSNLFSQGINQDINTITVKGVTFKQVVSRLVTSGYTIDALNDKSETVRTKFLKCSPGDNMLNLSISARVRDSVAEIKGRLCYNINNNRNGLPDSARSEQAKYTFGPYKAAFLQVDKFAKTFKCEIIYSRSD